MAYTTNPQLPRLRMQAVMLVRDGWTTRKVARHMGYSHSTIVRWCQKAPAKGSEKIPTKSSRPRSHPRALAPEVVQAILGERRKRGRCAEVVHAELVSQGIVVSLSSVKRTLQRHEMTKDRTKYRRPRIRVPRPAPICPGALVEADTVHILDWMTGERFYIYTVIDVHSRWAYAELHEKLKNTQMLNFILRAQAKAGFTFQVLQTDNGPEFATWFRNNIQAQGITLRHTHVRSPNENGHIERFNRSIQEECVGYQAALKYTSQDQIDEFLDYYNNERRHMGINMRRPAEVVQRS